ETIGIPKEPTAKAKAKETVDHLKNALDAFKQINDILGEKGEIGNQVDAGKYAKIKPILKYAWDEIVAAGKTGAEFVQIALKNLSPKGKPYFEKFVREEVGGGEKHEPIRKNIEAEAPGQRPEKVQGAEKRGAETLLGGKGRTGEAIEKQAGEGRLEGFRSRGDRPPGSSEYAITDEDGLGQGGPKQKYHDNVSAIKLLKKIGDSEATPEEQAVLVKYVGWGGLPQAFTRPDGTVASGWDNEVKELRSLLANDEYTAARNSTKNAHYTSQDVAKAIYNVFARFGFKGGKVLEPSVGTGNFIGLMPGGLWASSKFTAVELDPLTATIAKKLYPTQKIVNAGFETVFLAPDSFDAAIGNPPFGDDKLFDPENKDLRNFSIHNFFFAKSLKALRPNGILGMVVSSSMMDKIGGVQRQWIADHAELIGAIRLPNNAFKENALTEVTTDIIFLRKREAGEGRTGETWLKLERVQGKDNDWRVNEYFARHPENVLGEYVPNKLHPGEVVDGIYNAVAGVKAPGSFDSERLSNAITALPENIYKPDGHTIDEVQKPDIIVSDPGFAKPFGYTLDNRGMAVRRLPDINGEPQYEYATYAGKPYEGNRLDRFKALMNVRDAVRRLLRAEVSDDPKMKAYRKYLNRVYDGFVDKFGYISADINSWVLTDDPVDLPLLRSLETGYDKGISKALSKSTGRPVRKPSAQKVSIFTQRSREPYKEASKADSVTDGLAITLRERGIIDLDHIASLTGKSIDDVIHELRGVIFQDPDTGKWETSDNYLS
ncbi:MAG: N-6 DNA methylase, partial [Candidatus Margulisiibacteriota bacterium]